MKSLKKFLLMTLVTTLALTVLPVASVFAAGQNDISAPPQDQVSTVWLERIWARQQRIFDRLGRTDALIDRVQRLIDLARASGRDVSALQAALDAFEAAAKDSRPMYESMKGIISSHPGFDESGKVTDPVKARETIREMRAKIQEIKTAMNGTGRVLRDAIREFRQANPQLQPAVPSPGA